MTREEREEAIKNIKEHCYFANLIPQAKKALDNAIKALEQETCEDAISRKAVLDIAKSSKSNWIDNSVLFKRVNELTPVTPQPKTGHWIEKHAEDGCGERYSYWACSECGRDVGFNLANIEDVLSDYPYCHCGAKMVEQQKSEGEE